MFLGVSWYQSPIQNQYVVDPGKSDWLSPPNPQMYSYSCKEVYVSLGKDWGKANSKTFRYFSQCSIADIISTAAHKRESS